MPLDALYSAATGMLAQQTSLDNISNNLANVNTAGFKRGRASFADLLYTELTPQQAKMKSCNADASAKSLKGAERKEYDRCQKPTARPFHLSSH